MRNLEKHRDVTEGSGTRVHTEHVHVGDHKFIERGAIWDGNVNRHRRVYNTNAQVAGTMLVCKMTFRIIVLLHLDIHGNMLLK